MKQSRFPPLTRLPETRRWHTCGRVFLPLSANRYFRPPQIGALVLTPNFSPSGITPQCSSQTLGPPGTDSPAGPPSVDPLWPDLLMPYMWAFVMGTGQGVNRSIRLKGELLLIPIYRTTLVADVKLLLGTPSYVTNTFTPISRRLSSYHLLCAQSSVPIVTPPLRSHRLGDYMTESCSYGGVYLLDFPPAHIHHMNVVCQCTLSPVQ